MDCSAQLWPIGSESKKYRKTSPHFEFRDQPAVPGVRSIDKLWVRKTGLEYLADIHIQVDAMLSVDEGHRIGHLVQDRLVGEFPELRDAIIHLEPFPHIRQRS